MTRGRTMGGFGGSVVVVTGAGSGIGRSLALAFAREGACVHLADRDLDRVRAVAAEAGAAATPHLTDCADAVAVAALADRVFAASGRVDVLCNVAGVVGGGPVASIGLDQWRRVLGVNLYGVIHGFEAFVPRMIGAGRGGHVVNVASMAGLVAFPTVAPYSASKFAVVGLSEALAPELAAHGIRLTCVCPGMVRTAVFRDANLRLPGDWGGRIARLMDRFGADPDRVAAAILRDVRRGRRLSLVAGGWMRPVWLIKRAWPWAWAAALEAATGWAIRAMGGEGSGAGTGGGKRMGGVTGTDMGAGRVTGRR